MTTQFLDRAPVAGTREMEGGYLAADANCVRVGIQHYLASELGMDGNGLVAVYRPESEVFDRESVASFARVPVTLGHPADAVSAETWKADAVGETDGEVMRDGERLRIPLVVRDGAAIKAVRDGVRELSAGYTAMIDHTPGIAPCGTPYQAVQRHIRGNHIAIVARGRAGSECRIGDADTWGARPVHVSDTKEDRMSDALKTVVLGDAAVQVAADAVAIIDRWKADTAKAVADAKAEADAAVAVKDAEIARKDAEISDLQGKVLSDADLDARVEARAALVSRAKALVKDVEVAGKSEADIRRAVVAVRCGDAAVADRSDAYVEARFDALADAGPDPVRSAMNDARPEGDVYTEQRKRLADAWKTPVQEA